MIMRLTDIGSQCLIQTVDSKGEYFDGNKAYKVALPANITAEKFWSFTVYDIHTRSCSIHHAQVVKAIRRRRQRRAQTVQQRFTLVPRSQLVSKAA
jgi:hypothetical protein